MTWCVTLPGAWGTRLDSEWLPADHTEVWRRVFAGEDLAGQLFRSGGQDLPWARLANVAGVLCSVLPHYRQQLRVAEDESVACDHREVHLAAISAAGEALTPPSRTHPPGRWRVRALVDGAAAVLGEHTGVDLAEGDAAARSLSPDVVACWAEPVAAGPAPGPLARPPGWAPVVHPGLRRRAFAVEDAVANLCLAAAEGHTGPDVLAVPLLCSLGVTAWHMIREYRTLFRAAWASLDACPRAAEHEAAAQAGIDTAPEQGSGVSIGAWRHALLIDSPSGLEAAEVSVHGTRTGAAASVAAHRAVDEFGVRWTEPVTMAPRRPRWLPGSGDGCETIMR